MSKSRSVGTQLKINSKAVGAVTSISGPSVSGDEVDVTALDNSTGYREFLQGFKDGGEIQVDGWLDGADEGQTELYTLLNSGATSTCLIIFPTTIGKTWTATVFVSAFSTSADVDGAIGFSVTLRISGQPVLAASTSA